jgi:hypothetical protein
LIIYSSSSLLSVSVEGMMSAGIVSDGGCPKKRKILSLQGVEIGVGRGVYIKILHVLWWGVWHMLYII